MENNNLIIISIVAIVAIVAMVFMFGGNGQVVSQPTEYVVSEDGDLAGQAMRSISPIAVSKKGYEYAQWICANNHTFYQNSSCKTLESWQNYAEDMCGGYCTNYTTGINTFNVSGLCYYNVTEYNTTNSSSYNYTLEGYNYVKWACNWHTGITGNIQPDCKSKDEWYKEIYAVCQNPPEQDCGLIERSLIVGSECSLIRPRTALSR